MALPSCQYLVSLSTSTISMKIEQLLVQHFYQEKTITLQGIGIFTLNADIVFPGENDKDLIIPTNSISFVYNGRAEEDNALINYIVQQSRKIRPLAAADLDSYLLLGRQFLNIGKPFYIDGIGTLNKNQSGQYEFIPGHFINAEKDLVHTEAKEKIEETISFASESKSKSSKKFLIITAAIVVFAMGAWGVWYWLNNKKDPAPVSNAIPNSNSLPVADTLSIKTKDSLPITNTTVTPTLSTSSPYTFKIVFENTTNKAAAEKRMISLINRGHKVIIYSTDSVHFKLAEPFTRPLSDTTYVKDSLNQYYYNNKGRVEL